MVVAIVSLNSLTAFAGETTADNSVSIHVTGTSSFFWSGYPVFFYDSTSVTASACGSMSATSTSVTITCSNPIVAVCWDKPGLRLSCQYMPRHNISIQGGGPMTGGEWHRHISVGTTLSIEKK